MCCEALCLNVTGTEADVPIKGSEVEEWGIGVGLFYNFLKSLIKFTLLMI